MKNVAQNKLKMPTCRNWIICSFMRTSDSFWHKCTNSHRRHTLSLTISVAYMAWVPSFLPPCHPLYSVLSHCEHCLDRLEAIFFKLFIYLSIYLFNVLIFLVIAWQAPLWRRRFLFYLFFFFTLISFFFFLRRVYSTWLVCRSISWLLSVRLYIALAIP